jgi:hypothetical protein
MKTFKTYLPIFSGFYYTIWDEAERFEEYELDNESDFREHYPELSAVSWEDIQNKFWECLDYVAGNLAVAQAALHALPKVLPGFVKSVAFEELSGDDSVYCEIGIDVEAVLAYLAENAAAFAAWLEKRYTSYDGFISFHSTDPEDWLDPEGWGGHQAGAILDFIAQEELNEPDLELYEAANPSEAFSNAVSVDTSKLLN